VLKSYHFLLTSLVLAITEILLLVCEYLFHATNSYTIRIITITVMKTDQLSGTCNVQCFQIQKRHMAASTVKKNNSSINNIEDLVTYYIFNKLYESLRNC